MKGSLFKAVMAGRNFSSGLFMSYDKACLNLEFIFNL